MTEPTGGPLSEIMSKFASAVCEMIIAIFSLVPFQMRDERGFSIIWVLVGLALLVAAVFATCDAMWDDEDEVDDLGQGVELVASGDDNRGGRNKNGRDCEGSQDCSTLSPSFEDSPVILCLPGSTCHF